ncbi:MAG TPA: hypothetical protein VKB02_09290 [Pyrinomonadaceae bacterium]|nr:hypothetical protein [Pyrinomonadaceae bacterium]
MKAFTKLLFLVTLCSACTYSALGQKARSKPRKPSKSQVVCSVEAVPQGMVIVGYKDNAVCETGSELLVKKPTDSETVCANSPVPDGYSVDNIIGSVECRDASPNPLTNSLVITRGGRDDSTSIAPTPSYTRPSFSREITVKVTTGSSREQAPVKSPLEERAEKVNAEAKIENAANRREIVVGMTMDQVLKAWGSPQSRSNTTTSRSGTDSTWTYYRKGQSVDLYFKDGILDDWVWRH